MIYFIQEGLDGPIKIGTALDVAKRLKPLQAGNPRPLRVLALSPGDWRDETRLHMKLSRHHIRGEWFEATQEVLSESDRSVEELRAWLEEAHPDDEEEILDNLEVIRKVVWERGMIQQPE